ncbi:MAG: hypothetical protein JJU36_12405 [Phycisphaeraceae bacterium]|nr:hypothetical protein [Phycisphaeraceae bacterium]
MSDVTGPRQREHPSPADLAIDVHCHLLPRVDDGAKNDDEAVECVHALADMGYRGSVLTPHIAYRSFRGKEDDLRVRFEKFRSRVHDRLPDDYRLALGAEYMLDDIFMDRLYRSPEKLLTFGPDRGVILLELPRSFAPPFLDQVLRDLSLMGVVPVLAHIERYTYAFLDEGADLRRWRESGALLQVNVGAFAGSFGDGCRSAAVTCWERGWIDLLGTDLHAASSLKSIKDGWNAIRALEPGPGHGLSGQSRLLSRSSP